VYRAAVDAAARYVADCAYEAAGDEDAHECWQNATVPRYLTQEYKPAADVAHVAACRALAAVCRDPWPSASAIALERDLDEIGF